MKTTLLAAAAALSLFACSNATDETAASTEASETTNADVTTAVDLDVDVATLGDLRCKILKGSFILFTFQNRKYAGYAADDFASCTTKLWGLERSGTRHGTITRHTTSVSVSWTLDLGDGFVFSSHSTLEKDDGIVVTTTKTVDLVTTPDLAKCRMLKGAFVEIKVDGNAFRHFAGIGMPACNAAVGQFNAAARHQGTLTSVIYDTYAHDALDLDRGVWKFESWHPTH